MPMILYTSRKFSHQEAMETIHRTRLPDIPWEKKMFFLFCFVLFFQETPALLSVFISLIDVMKTKIRLASRPFSDALEPESYPEL
jgi:hypothetical protein